MRSRQYHLGFATWLAVTLAPSARGHEGLAAKIESVTQRIAERPGDAALLLERAEYHRLERAWRAALADLKQAQRLDAALAAIPLARARLFVDAGEGTRALAELDAAETLQPGLAAASLLRARALAELDRGVEAVAAFDEAIARAPRPDPDVYFARAELQESLGGAWRARAIAGLDEGVARLGGAVQLEEKALRLEEAGADWDAALRRVDRLGRGSPRPLLWKARAAELLELAGRDAEALAAAEATLAAGAREPAHVRARPDSRELADRMQRVKRRLTCHAGS